MLVDRRGGELAAAFLPLPAESHTRGGRPQLNRRGRARKEFPSPTARVSRYAQFNGTGDTSHASFEIDRDRQSIPTRFLWDHLHARVDRLCLASRGALSFSRHGILLGTNDVRSMQS